VLTMLGEVSIERIGFYSPKATAQFPLDSALNLPPDAQASIELRGLVTRKCANGSFENACETLNGE